MDEDDLNKILDEYYEQAKENRIERDARTQENLQVYLGKQDWSEKIEGMSTDFYPKLFTAVNQIAALIKKGLLQVGNWFEADLRKAQVITKDEVVSFLTAYFEMLPDVTGRQFSTIQDRIHDAVKLAILSGNLTVKVYCRTIDEVGFNVEQGEPILDPEGFVTPGEFQLRQDIKKPRGYLCIDVVDPYSYFVDPTGRGLYEIHVVERDYYQLLEMAKKGIYKLSKVKELGDTEIRAEEDLYKASIKSRRRKTVRVEEFWGNVIDVDGNLVYENVVITRADGVIIRRESNPYWHGLSPFVSFPLIKAPLNGVTIALADHASALNLAFNEIMNLIVDGGLASVWGIKQLRTEFLEDISEISAGISQGTTLRVNSTLPPNAKVLEKVVDGAVPPEAFQVAQILQGELAATLNTNDLRLGSLARRNVLATEVNEISSSQDSTLDAMLADIEVNFLVPLIEKAWSCLIQEFDALNPLDAMFAGGPRFYFIIKDLDPVKRWALLCNRVGFRVFGLSSIMTKAKDFTKLMALLQAVNQNPVLMMAFFKTRDPVKVISQLERLLSINPQNFERDDTNEESLQNELQQLGLFSQFISGGSGGLVPTGDTTIPAEVNQMVNPATGLTVNN